MSMNKFCHHCGKKLNVGDKFCGGCGTSLSSLAATPTPPPKPATPSFAPFAVAKDDDDDDYIDRLEHINLRQAGLQVEIIKDRPIGETIGVAMANAQPLDPNDTFKRGGIDPEQALALFQKEAGTLRNDK
jgi:hypothetical protein